jgi:hypothetical protein
MSETDHPDAVFADTCILLNFVQREWEGDQTSTLIESELIEIVISQSVYEEFKNVCERREDIYPDFLDFMLEEDGELEEYDPASRRVYFDSNDIGHVRSIQYELADVEGRREAQYRLRRFIREAESRIEYLEAKFSTEDIIDPFVPLDLRFALDKLIEHSADVRVITDAAAWTANGGSSVLVTLDSEDILGQATQINKILQTEQGDKWILSITVPRTILDSNSEITSAEQLQGS